MFVAGISVYAALIFSLLSYSVAVPSAVKVFNWTATLYKGSIRYDAPMLYAFGFLGLFTIGGLTGLFLCRARHRRARHRHLLRRRPLPLHHGRRRAHGISRRHAFLVAENFRPLYPEGWARLAALIVFIGFNLTFFPQFILGYLGMPRRYYQYPPEFQMLNVLSTAGATVLGVGYLLPMIYFLWSMRYGKPAPDNPWNAAGLEWQTPSPPPTFNFEEEPVVTWEAYNYDEIDAGHKQEVPLPDSQAVSPYTRRSPQSGAAAPLRRRRAAEDASSLGMWIFLATEVMFFGGMFCAYLIYRRWYFGDFGAASKSINAALGATNTAVLICSSLTVVLAIWAAQTARRGLLLVMLVLTMLFGCAFLGIKGIEYKDKFEEHHVPGASFSFDHVADSRPSRTSTPIRNTPRFSSLSTSS